MNLGPVGWARRGQSGQGLARLLQNLYVQLNELHALVGKLRPKWLRAEDEAGRA